MKRLAFVLSHLAMAGLGAWFTLQSRQNVPPLPVVVTPAPVRQPPAVVPKADLPTKVARASPAAWRGVWDEALVGPRGQNGELGIPNSIGFFVDWCEIDPEGAIRALAKTYAPYFAHNYINNAVQAHGAILAPALVKHYRELRLMADYKVSDYLGKSLNKLAKDDPAQAAGLLASLPPGVRNDVYRQIFDKQDRKSLDQLYVAMPPAGPDEAIRRSENYVSGVEVAEPEQGVWKGIAEAGDPALRKAFASEGIRKALRGENWTEFFNAVEKLEPAAREEVRQTMESQLPGGAFSEKARAAISGECSQRGLDDWTRKLK